MPLTNLGLKNKDRHYDLAALIETRRQMLRFARSLPRGPERNERRQTAASLGRLFKSKAWQEAHIIKEPATRYQVYTVDSRGNSLNEVDIASPDDRAAVKSAKQFVDGHDIELWQGDRKVKDFEHKD